MKIVTVMTTSASGGAEFAAVEMLDALAERGHECVMLSDRPDIGRDSRVQVRPIETGPKLSAASWRGLMMRFPAHAREMRRALEREYPYDALLLHYKKEQLLSLALPQRLRPALVWAEWGPVPVQMRSGPGRRLYLAATGRAGRVMAISHGTSRSLADVGVPTDKIEVVPNVMRTEELAFTASGRARVRTRLGIPDDAFVVGCVSRFHPKKRNDVVVDAVARLGDDTHLILAGAGETEDQLRELAEPLGRRAHFVPTPGADVADVVSAFDVSVFCPSPAEGAPRAVILGMLAERVCVSTGAEGVDRLIGAGAGEVIAPENDPDALAEVLIAYRDDPARRVAEGRLARERAVEMHDAPVVAGRIERVFAAARAA
jgi:glycosyltransferase involved in cell wall biosynthesis